MKPLLLILALMALFSMTLAAAEQTPASQYLANGYGPTAAGLGFTGITLLGDPDAGAANPATLGDLRRVANSFSVTGLGADSPLFATSLAVPTDIGVLSAHFLYGTSSFSNAAQNLGGLALRIAKPITDNLFWGFGLSFLYADFERGIDRGFWADTGLIWRLPTKGKGLGLFDPTFGFTLCGLGIRVREDGYDRYPPLGLGFGAAVTPVIAGPWKMRLQSDLLAAVDPLNPSLSFGMENTLFDFLSVRLGYLAGDNEHGLTGIGAMTFGLGIKGSFTLREKTDFDLSYALVQQNIHGKAEKMHSLGFTIAWGAYDSSAPEMKIRQDAARFSPNFDGSRDEARFGLDIGDNRMVYGWKLDILDSTGKTNRSFHSVDRFELRTLTLAKFFDAIFSAKKQVDIPRHVAWNGQDAGGQIVADGTYAWVLSAWDENRNLAVTKGSVAVDTKIPQVRASATNAIFSPNNDGVLETFAFDLTVLAADPADRLVVTVRDSRGRAVRTWTASGDFPRTLAWDGRDDGGDAAPEDVYSIDSEIADAAGNRTADRIAALRLVRRYETVNLAAEGESFSPTGDGVADALRFRTATTSANGLLRWQLLIRDAEKRVVRTIAGTGALPAELVWDGLDDTRQPLADGFYSGQTSLFYESGNHPQSRQIFVEIDKTPATVAVTPAYLEFSPNGDGKRDTITFEHGTKGQAGDAVRVAIADKLGNTVLTRDWKLGAFPGRFEWNGLDANGKVLPEGRYSYKIETTDEVGNKSRVAVSDILLKTGLEKVALEGDRGAISPGLAGDSRRVVFTPTVTSTDKIERFDVVIRNADGKVVRSFTNRSYVPRVEWDGRDGAGEKLPDGTYGYSLRVKYSYGDEPVSAGHTVVLDSVAPRLDVGTDGTIFSPNGDGRRETIEIRQKVAGGPGDSYTGQIVDAGGRVVREYRWTETVPEKIVWDGKDAAGQTLGEGRYAYRLAGLDAAGNASASTTLPVELVRRTDTVTLTASGKEFSPNGDGHDDALTLRFAPSSRADIESCELVVFDRARRGVLKKTWNGAPDEMTVWNGTDRDGRPLLDGYYDAELTVNYRSGNIAQTELGGILLDARPPEVNLTLLPRVFTPDGDGENDTFFINPAMRDVSGVVSWSIEIAKRDEKGGAVKPFKTFRGTTPPAAVLGWDGRSDDGEDTVEAVQDYRLVLVAKDRMGNTTKREETVTVGVLVERLPEGLRIRVSSVQFAFDQDDLVGNSEKTLDKVIFIIRRILSEPAKYGLPENAKIEISGHTDDVGDAAYNLDLSRRRARTVLQYLLKKDVDPRILTSAGYGMSRPFKEIRPGMDFVRINENRARNRRVEFFIRK